MVDPLDPCCLREAQGSLRKARDVAVCDGCGRLLLAWTDPEEQRRTRVELTSHGASFAEGKVGELYVTSKARG